LAKQELVCVRLCQGVMLGEIYKSKLEAAGIPAMLKYESAGRVLGITVDGLGRVEVLVPAEMAEDAAALLADIGDEAASDGESD